MRKTELGRQDVTVTRSYYLPQFDSNILQLGEDIELWVVLEVCMKPVLLGTVMVGYYVLES